MRKIVVFLILTSVMAPVALSMSLVREFSTRTVTQTDAADLPSTAVVFTGQFDRIALALSLFEQGEIDRIFISGVNSGAGVTQQGFAEQFQISSHARAALGSGQIILAPDANTTIENAMEASCWLDTQPSVREIVLITGRYHMPRASWALERASAGSISVRRLYPTGPAASDTRSRPRLLELAKFGATVVFTALPRQLWPATQPTSCM